MMEQCMVWSQVVHVSNKPIAVKSIIINMETLQSNVDDDSQYKVK